MKTIKVCFIIEAEDEEIEDQEFIKDLNETIEKIHEEFFGFNIVENRVEILN